MKSTTIATPLLLHTPDIRAPKPLPKPPQKISPTAINASSNINVKKSDSHLIVAQSNSFVDDLDAKREKLGSEQGQFVDKALGEVESSLALLEYMETDDTAGTTFSAADLASASAKLEMFSSLMDKTSHIKTPPKKSSSSGSVEQNQLSSELKAKSKNLMDHVGIKIDQQLQDEVQVKTHRARPIRIKITKSAVERNNISGQANAFLLKGMIPGKPLADQINNCKKQITNVKNALQQMDAEVQSLSSTEASKSAAPDAAAAEKIDLKELQHSLEGMLLMLENYQSPTSVQNICIAKIFELQAARLAIPSTDKDNKPINQELLSFIDARISYIASIRDNPEGHDGPTLLGKAQIAWPLAKLHPMDAAKQKTMLEKSIKLLVEKISDAKNTSDFADIAKSLQTTEFSERMVLMELMKSAEGISDVITAFGKGLDQTLRHQDWAPVSTEILLPIEQAPDGKVKTAKVKTDLTCQGTVMTDKSKIEILSKNSPLKPNNFDELKNPDTVDSKGNKKVSTGGVRSRSIEETKNPTMAAHTSASLEGKEVFAGTRTGVNDPYGIHKKSLKQKPAVEVAGLTRDLIGPDTCSPTQINLGNSSANKCIGTDGCEL